MQPIFGTAAVLTAPPSPLLSSGYVPGNTLAAQHLNFYLYHLTKELNNVLSAAGLSQNTADDTQVYQAIEILIGMHVAVVSGTVSYSMPASGYTTFLQAVPAGSGSAVFNVQSAAGIIGSAITIIKTDTGSGFVQVKPNGSDVFANAGSASLILGSQWQSITFMATASGQLSVLSGVFNPHQTVDTDGSQVPLGRLIHLPLGNTTSREIINLAPPPNTSAFSAAIQATGVVGIPAGAKGIRARINIDAFATGAGDAWLLLAFSDNSANAPTPTTAHPEASERWQAASAGAPANRADPPEIDIPLNTAGQFYVYNLNNGNVTLSNGNVSIVAVGYYMGV